MSKYGNWTTRVCDYDGQTAVALAVGLAGLLVIACAIIYNETGCRVSPRPTATGREVLCYPFLAPHNLPRGGREAAQYRGSSENGEADEPRIERPTGRATAASRISPAPGRS